VSSSTSRLRLGVIAAASAALATGALAPSANASTATSASRHGLRVVDTVDVKANPFGDTTAPDGRTVWVANSGPVGASGTGSVGHTVTILNARTHGIESVIDVGVFPEDIVFTHGGRQALVTNSTSNTVSVIDAVKRKVTQTVDLSGAGLEFPFGIAATKDSHKVFVTTLGNVSPASIAVLNDSDPDHVFVQSTINVPGFANRPGLTPDGRLLLVPFGRPGTSAVPEVLLIDTRTDGVVGDLTLPGQGATQAATVTPDGRFAYVSIFGGFFGGTGGIWVIDLAERSTVTVIQTPDVANEGVNVSPDGEFVFATDFLIAKVSVIDTQDNQIVANVPVGNQPNETAFTADGRRAFVTNQGDTTVSVISVPDE
jgi:YVTN family beta-propeller protein